MRENKNLEFKAEITNTFLKTVSAFANFATGTIRFGISDDGETVGIADLDRSCLDIENKINDNIKPKPDFFLSVDKKNKVITLTVEEGKYKPYLYKGKAYRRSDTASVEVDQVELKRLVLAGSNLYYEMLPIKVKDLEFDHLEKKLIEKLGVKSLSEDMLRTLGFFTEDGQYNNAAYLFADQNDFFGVDIARFGDSINEILDRETYSKLSILKIYDLAVAMYRRYYQYEKIEGMERKKVDLLPERAFREAIANALVHRTWDVDNYIRISMYKDRIEIASPGGLVKGVTEEEYLRGDISSLRNPIVGNVFFRLHYIEMFGTGIRRIIESYKDCAKQPLFHISDNAIVVTLPTITYTYKTTPEEQSIIDLLSEGRKLSSREIAEYLGWRKDKVIRIINVLKEVGYVSVSGKGRSTRYSVNID